MNLDQIEKKMNFLIHHYDTSDVSDWIICKHELQKWKKEQVDYQKELTELKKYVEKMRKETFDIILMYDPQMIVKILKIDGIEFVRKKKSGLWEKSEIEKVLREVLCE